MEYQFAHNKSTNLIGLYQRWFYAVSKSTQERMPDFLRSTTPFDPNLWKQSYDEQFAMGRDEILKLPHSYDTRPFGRFGSLAVETVSREAATGRLLEAAVFMVFLKHDPLATLMVVGAAWDTANDVMHVLAGESIREKLLAMEGLHVIKLRTVYNYIHHANRETEGYPAFWI